MATAYTTKVGTWRRAFHLQGSPAGEAETVFLGVFQKKALQAVGGFDETLHRAQDWELNYRLRSRGHKICTTRPRVTHRPRSSLGALVAQMYQTGKWQEVLRRHPGTASARYLAPPVAVLDVGMGPGIGLLGLVTRPACWTGFLAPAGYLALFWPVRRQLALCQQQTQASVAALVPGDDSYGLGTGISRGLHGPKRANEI